MLKLLLRSIPIILLFHLNDTQAQQPEDCSSCACTPSSMLGATLYTSTNQPVCDPNLPSTYSVDVSRFGRFYAAQGNRYTISLCAEGANTMAYITTNTTIPGIIYCDDNGCGTADGPSILSFIPATDDLYRLYVFDSNCGAQYPVSTMMEIMITCTPTPPPANNLPCTATPLPLNGTACNFINGDNTGATNSNAAAPVGIGNIAVPSCTGATYQGSDLWYSVQVPASGLIGIQTQENTLCAGAFELYTATNCAVGSTFVPLPNGCTTVGLSGPTSEPEMIFDALFAGLSPGETVYIRYWERNGNENGSFGICAFDGIDFVGIEDQEDRGPFQVFPNPNTGNFTITNTGDAARLGIRLIDIGGRSIHSTEAYIGTNSPFSIDLGGDVSPGLYQLQLIDGKSTRSLPLMLE